MEEFKFDRSQDGEDRHRGGAIHKMSGYVPHRDEMLLIDAEIHRGRGNYSALILNVWLPKTTHRSTWSQLNRELEERVEKTIANYAAKVEEAKAQAAPKQTEPVYDIHKRVFEVQKNVDIAYVRVKGEFNFYDLDMVAAEHGESAWQVIQDPRFKYEGVPGVFYKMRDVRKHNGNWLTIDSEVEKRTDTTTQITVRYWLPEGTTATVASRTGDELQQRINRALQL